MNTTYYGKTSLFVKQDYEQQLLIYGVLESTNDLRGTFVGHIHFRKFIEIFCCAWLDSGPKNKISFNHIYL